MRTWTSRSSVISSSARATIPRRRWPSRRRCVAADDSRRCSRRATFGFSRTRPTASVRRSGRWPMQATTRASWSIASRARTAPGSCRPCCSRRGRAGRARRRRLRSERARRRQLLSTPWFASARDETELKFVGSGLDLAARDDARRADWLQETAGGAQRVPARSRRLERSAADAPHAARRGLSRSPAAAAPRTAAETACARRSSSSASGSSAPSPPRVLERPRQQPVGERGVSWQQRAVQVGADRRRHPAALEARARRRSRGRRGRGRAASRRDRAACGRRGSRTPPPSSRRRHRDRPRAARRRSAASRRRASRSGKRPAPGIHEPSRPR